MKQTAVEWQHIELSKFLYGKSEFTDANDILIKAKEMEKEQMIKSILDNRNITSQVTYLDAEQYYNETYGGGEQ